MPTDYEAKAREIVYRWIAAGVMFKRDELELIASITTALRSAADEARREERDSWASIVRNAQETARRTTTDGIDIGIGWWRDLLARAEQEGGAS